MTATTRRAARGQRVTRHDTWYWECDHAHEPGATWWDRAETQDVAYAALEQHNTEQHPGLVKEADRG